MFRIYCIVLIALRGPSLLSSVKYFSRRIRLKNTLVKLKQDQCVRSHTHLEPIKSSFQVSYIYSSLDCTHTERVRVREGGASVQNSPQEGPLLVLTCNRERNTNLELKYKTGLKICRQTRIEVIKLLGLNPGLMIAQRRRCRMQPTVPQRQQPTPKETSTQQYYIIIL